MENNYRPSDAEREASIKRENIGFVQHVFWQITDVIRAFSRVMDYSCAAEFRRNVQFIHDATEATETLLISYLDDEYWAKRKEIMDEPVRDFEDVYGDRLKDMNRFDYFVNEDINNNRDLYHSRKNLEKLKLIFRELMKWAGKNKLLFQLDKDKDV